MCVHISTTEDNKIITYYNLADETIVMRNDSHWIILHSNYKTMYDSFWNKW